ERAEQHARDSDHEASHGREHPPRSGSMQAALTMRRYLPILGHMPRRKPGTLLPLETEILEATLALLRAGDATFHGFGLAQLMRERSGSRSPTPPGTPHNAPRPP